MINVTDNCEDFKNELFNLLKYISLDGKKLKLLHKGGEVEKEIINEKYELFDITDICKYYNIPKPNHHIPEEENIHFIKNLLNKLH